MLSPGSLIRMRNVKAVPAHQARAAHAPGGTRLSRGEGGTADMSRIVLARDFRGIGPRVYDHGRHRRPANADDGPM
ncbi:hypothetical protein GCM10010151_70630 [Actinoallomurus spadix]|uniref:Uncharacterized protein n=1 Tax=Actinoallomurus spadix TaxID=79912 RepID=A0ABN0XQZ4_9ACTN